MNIRSGQVTLNNFTKNNKTRLEREVREIEPELPEGWRAIEIGRVVKGFRSGFACSKKYAKESGIPHLRPNNIGFYGELNLSQLVFLPAEMVDLSKYSLKEGDVLFNNTNSKELVGRASLVKQNLECGFSNHITRLRVNKELITSEWLVHCINYLWLEGFFLKLCRKWIGQAGVNTKMLKSTIIPLPPLEEQRRLVVSIEEIMSRIGQARKLREEALKDTEAVMQSALNQIFSKTEGKGWKSKRLGEICSHVRYGLTAKSSTIPEGVLFIRITDIDADGTLRLTEPHYVKTDDNTIEKFSIRKGDILIARSGATAGKAYLCNLEKKAVFASYLIRFRFKEEIVMPEFIFYFLQSPLYWKQLQIRKVGGAQPNVNAQNLKSLKIPIPPLEQQESIVIHLNGLWEKIRMLKKHQEKTEEEIEAMTQAVLRKAFSGEL